MRILSASPELPARQTYRRWDIFQGRYPEPAWSATGPDYDASYEGPEDGWVATGGHVWADTRESLLREIDNWIEENEPARHLPSREEIAAIIALNVRLEWHGHDHASINPRSVTIAADAILSLIRGDTANGGEG